MAGWLLLVVLFSIGLCGGRLYKPVSAADLPPVVLKEKVELSHPPVMLSDLIKGELPPELSDIYLGDLPVPGKGKFVTCADIIIEARRQEKKVPDFSGPNQRVHIIRPEKIVRDSELEPRVRKLLENRFADYASNNIEITKVPRKVKLLPGEYKLELGNRNQYQEMHGAEWYDVRVIQGKEYTAEFRIKADISQKVKVPVARNSITNGDVIRAGDIIWEERERSSIYGGTITDSEAVIGFETKRSFRPGQVIVSRSLKRPLAVKRNNPVTIKYSFNGIKVNARGIAQGQGAIGEKIMVENSSSKEKVYAEIIDKRTVTVNNGKS